MLAVKVMEPVVEEPWALFISPPYVLFFLHRMRVDDNVISQVHIPNVMLSLTVVKTSQSRQISLWNQTSLLPSTGQVIVNLSVYGKIEEERSHSSVLFF